MSFVRPLLLGAASAGLVALHVGCSQQPQAGGQQPVVVVTPDATPTPPAPTEPPPSVKKDDRNTAAQPQPQPQPKKDEPPPTFKFPADAAGQAVAKVVTPQPPPPPASEKLGAVPKGRTPPARVVEPDAITKAHFVPPPILGEKAAGPKPAAPAERVPLDLGFGAYAPPEKATMPETPGITTRAKDVNVPPELPPLARQVPDRASLEDPTTEPGNAAIVARPVSVPLMQSGFLRIALPDPFELADQVKPKVAPAAEPAIAPVVVNPARPQ